MCQRNRLPAILEASYAGTTLLPTEAPFSGRLEVLLPTPMLEETHDSVIAFLSPSAYMSGVTDFYLCKEFEIKLEKRGYHFVF